MRYICFSNVPRYFTLFIAIVAAHSNQEAHVEKANIAQQHVIMSQQAQIQAQQELDDIAHIVRNVREYTPHLQLQDDYIEHDVVGLRAARSKYEAATLEQQNTTSQLLTAQAATLEVMGETHALSEPNSHFNVGKVKDKPCILCRQGYTTEENLYNHILREHDKLLDDFVSIKCAFHFSLPPVYAVHVMFLSYLWDCLCVFFSTSHVCGRCKVFFLCICVYVCVCLSFWAITFE